MRIAFSRLQLIFVTFVICVTISNSAFAQFTLDRTDNPPPRPAPPAAPRPTPPSRSQAEMPSSEVNRRLAECGRMPNHEYRDGVDKGVCFAKIRRDVVQAENDKNKTGLECYLIWGHKGSQSLACGPRKVAEMYRGIWGCHSTYRSPNGVEGSYDDVLVKPRNACLRSVQSRR